MPQQDHIKEGHRQGIPGSYEGIQCQPLAPVLDVLRRASCKRLEEVMSVRMYRNLMAVLVVMVYLALLIILGGCTIYKVHSEPGKSVDVSVWSTRSFVAPDLNYTRTGEDASFSFGADQTTQPGPQDYAAGVAAGVKAMLPVPE